ncbi:MAG: Ig domain-containing protein [Streptosporangiaceae bacterium]
MAALGATSLAAPAGASTRTSTTGTATHQIHITRYFGYAGHLQRFHVPYGVRRIFVRAVGAAGGSTLNASGGHGAIVDALPFVHPGSTLYVAVGGTGSHGGYNGGGNGGGTGGAGGGGASDLQTFTGHRLVVAAGGGGAGNSGSCSADGGAGGNAGAAGAPGVTCTTADLTAGNGGGGYAGTLFTGGPGGSPGAGHTTPGTVGGAGTWAAGGIGQPGAGPGDAYGDSGGGGGGLYGGGGGGSGGYDITTTPAASATGAGGGGGGGSSFGRVVGLSYGHAYVVIRYTIPAPLMITTPSHLPRAIVGHYYSVTLRARGGVPPYLWTLTSGVLPRGLYLHHDGVLSGTPRAAGYSHFTVRVMDTTHRVAYQRFDLTVAGRADLAIRLSHAGYLRYHHTRQYWMKVTNTGTARTIAATRVTLALPAGLTAQHWSGAYWHCTLRPHFVVCVRSAPIAPHASTTIGVSVFVHAHAGRVLRSVARVSPSDVTPRDNTSVDLAVVRR